MGPPQWCLMVFINPMKAIIRCKYHANHSELLELCKPQLGAINRRLGAPHPREGHQPLAVTQVITSCGSHVPIGFLAGMLMGSRTSPDIGIERFWLRLIDEWSSGWKQELEKGQGVKLAWVLTYWRWTVFTCVYWELETKQYWVAQDIGPIFRRADAAWKAPTYGKSWPVGKCVLKNPSIFSQVPSLKPGLWGALFSQTSLSQFWRPTLGPILWYCFGVLIWWFPKKEVPPNHPF